MPSHRVHCLSEFTTKQPFAKSTCFSVELPKKQGKRKRIRNKSKLLLRGSFCVKGGCEFEETQSIHLNGQFSEKAPLNSILFHFIWFKKPPCFDSWRSLRSRFFLLRSNGFWFGNQKTSEVYETKNGHVTTGDTSRAETRQGGSWRPQRQCFSG